MEQSPSWEANWLLQLVKKFPAFLEPEGSSPYSQVPATCPYPEPTPSNPPQSLPTSWRSILILFSHLRLGLRNGLFPSGFPTRTLCTPLPSPILATCPVHLILLDFTTRTIFWEPYKTYKCNESSKQNFLMLILRSVFPVVYIRTRADHWSRNSSQKTQIYLYVQ